MSESWVIMHTKGKMFVCFPPKWNGTAKKVLPSWTVHLNNARAFPTEAAAKAVRSEWGLEELTRVAVICPSED